MACVRFLSPQEVVFFQHHGGDFFKTDSCPFPIVFSMEFGLLIGSRGNFRPTYVGLRKPLTVGFTFPETNSKHP